ncbi:MAG: bifunctional diguanylate cyclase/phosphohydrolase [Gaiellaceae bacterium]
MTPHAGEALSPSEPDVDRAVRLALFVFATSLAGGAAVVGAAALILRDPPGIEVALGILALGVAAAVAEAFPVPVHGVSAGGVSLAASFIVGASLIYDWRAAVLIGCVARGAIEIAQRRPFDRFLFNTSTYALAGAATGLGSVAFGPESSIGALFAAVILGSLSFYAVNIGLVASVVAVATGGSLRAVVRRSLSSTWIPFGLMATVSLLLEVMWTRSPFLAPTLLGPLVAVALYQRSARAALEAMRLAQTDPLTGLGNHRAFQEHLGQELQRAPGPSSPLTLCVVDVDHFKRINDAFGHPAGDAALVEIGDALRACGMAYRVGGDEFAVILPGRGPNEALDVMTKAFGRLAGSTVELGPSVRLSGGIASLPVHVRTRDELLDHADRALYEAKRQGRGVVCVFDERSPAAFDRRDRTAERRARLQAAGALAELLDAADGFIDDLDGQRGSHSQRVSELAREIAATLGLHEDDVNLVGLAGRLHDIGKLAIPKELLRKTQELTEPEMALMRDHVDIGARVLESLGAGDIARWILHHHERWDGTGYPYGLQESAIPLPARIIFVADSFDAMTSQRPYRTAVPHAEALSEIRRLAGRWYDPAVVAALEAARARAGSGGAPRLVLVA